MRELQGETKPIQNAPVTTFDTTLRFGEVVGKRNSFEDWRIRQELNLKPSDP